MLLNNLQSSKGKHGHSVETTAAGGTGGPHPQLQQMHSIFRCYAV